MNKPDNYLKVLALSLVVSLIVAVPLFAQMDKGMELYQHWEFQEAEKAFRQELQSNSGNFEARCYLGQTLLMQEKFEEALGIFSTAKERAEVKSGSPVADAYHVNLSLARAQLGLKRNEEAWKSLEDAERARPGTADVLVFRGVYHMQKQDLKKAARELEKAMEMDEENAYAHYYAGLVYLRQGHPAKAVDMLKMFLQLSPHAPEAFRAQTLITGLC
ncbi:MAG: tetratricopeptide repeat protein [Acidobacteria bacterium]|nr:tetratricopeptide repeat protein [Acidobacteriota bacterium]